MRRAIGVATAEHIATGLVEDGQLAGPLRFYEAGHSTEQLLTLPAASLAERLAHEIRTVSGGAEIEAIGIGLPGIIRKGLVEESPNLLLLKGADMQALVSTALWQAGIHAPVFLHNDADTIAAGLAATRGHLDRLIRVWTLGNGIGFGIFPWREGIWEGGHTVVSLDPREKYCGCGARGHLEGIVGYRAMRLRFLDQEPEEIFENARKGDRRCADFVNLWHMALAAATANSIHMAGPGKFFLTGFNARHVDLNLLDQYLQEMVTMSTLQGYVFEVVPSSEETAVLGAAVNALREVSPG
jgi:glucokinase